MDTDFAFVTYIGLKNLDPDDRLVLNALENKGYTCQAVIWDDPNIDWRSFKVTIMRSAWDYHLKSQLFLDWISLVSTQTLIVNSPEILRWNFNKRYLEELVANGTAIIPTVFLGKNQLANIQTIMEENNWHDIVVKPAIGLSTYGVKRIKPESVKIGQAHVENLLQYGDVLVQPYFSSVEDYGERDLIFIDGQYSHCVRKMRFQSLAVAGGAGETLVSPDNLELEFAQKVIQNLKVTPCCARVDLVRDPANLPCVIELELIDPNLFFQFHQPAIEMFVDKLIAIYERTEIKQLV